MTWHDVNNTPDALDQIYTMFVNMIKILRGQTQNNEISIQTILLLGGILSFLFALLIKEI